MDIMWNRIKEYFGDGYVPGSSPFNFYIHLCRSQPPRQRKDNDNYGIEIEEASMGLFTPLGETCAPACACESITGLSQCIEDYILAAPDSHLEVYSVHSGKNGTSVEELCEQSLRDAIQWWILWHGPGALRHRWKVLCLAILTVCDNLAIPPHQLVTGEFRFLGHTFSDILEGLRSENMHPDDIKLIEMSAWWQYIAQYVEKVEPRFRVITAGTQACAVLLLVIKDVTHSNISNIAVEMAGICDALSMDIGKEALELLQGEPTETVAGEDRTQRKRELRWIYARCSDILNEQGTNPLLSRFASAGMIFVPLNDRYQERRLKKCLPFPPALKTAIESFRRPQEPVWRGINGYKGDVGGL